MSRVVVYVLAAASISFLTYLLVPPAPAATPSRRPSVYYDESSTAAECPVQAAKQLTVLSTNSAPEVSPLDTSSKKALHDFYLGSWKDVDLEPLFKVHRDLDENFKKHGWQLTEGHSAHKIDELRMYLTIARLPKIKRICEIGFNAGHSASLWLLANPEAEVIMFDIGDHDYTKPTYEYLRDSPHFESLGIKNAKNRFKLYLGNSFESLARFRMEHPDIKCDLLSIDGGHASEAALNDIVYMKPLSNPHWNLVVIDDSNCGQRLGWCKTVEASIEEGERRGIFTVIDRSTYVKEGEGIVGGLTVATYTFPKNLF